MYVLGIDLGTTYTAAAVWREGRAEICPLGTRSAAVPSVVLVRADGSVLTGEAAARRAFAEPDRVAREFKRSIGDTIPRLLGGSPFSAETLTAKLLAAVMKTVTDREGGLPTRVCLSHPANWGPYKIDLLRQAVTLADLHVPVTFTTEPEAAAVAYARQERLSPGDTVAVYDLGGGTFDAAVLRRTDTGFAILGQPEGIERLGGIDIDAAVFAHVARTVGEPLAELDEDDPNAIAAMARLRVECTEAKEALSSDVDTTIPVLLPNFSTEVRLTRAELETMIRPPLYDSIEALHRALRASDVTAEDLSAVLLVGGSSRIPLVAQLVGNELGRPVAVDTHPKHAIATGAAWLASGAALPTEPAPATTVVTVYPQPGTAPRATAGPAPATVAVAATPPPGVPPSGGLPSYPQPGYPPTPARPPSTQPPLSRPPVAQPPITQPPLNRAPQTQPPGRAYPVPGYPQAQPQAQPQTQPPGYPPPTPTGRPTPPPRAYPQSPGFPSTAPTGQPFAAPAARTRTPLPDLPRPTPPGGRPARGKWLLPITAATVMLLLVALFGAWQLTSGDGGAGDDPSPSSAATLAPSGLATSANAPAPPPSNADAAGSAAAPTRTNAGGGATTTANRTFALTVTLSGSGTVSGAVTCPGACSAQISQGRTVQLTAKAASGFAFDGWTGCTSTSGASCSVTVRKATSVRATFSELVNPIDTGPGPSISTSQPPTTTTTAPPPTTTSAGTTTAGPTTSAPTAPSTPSS